MKTVTLNFTGHDADNVAQDFYTWMVDGGLEDSVIDTLSNNVREVEGISDFDNNTFAIEIKSKTTA